jgi:hypothetical protein
MTSTLITCADTASRPGAPATGDMLYQEDTKQIITYDGSVWQYYDSDGVGGSDLAYTGAKTGHPTSGTNYVCSVQPVVHYDASQYVELSASAAVLGGAVDAWGDRSGNGNDGTQATADDQPTLVQTAGGYRGLQWPDSQTLGAIETNYTPSSGQPGHTIVIAVFEPDAMSWSGIVNNWGYAAGGSLYNAGISAFDAGRFTSIGAGSNTYHNTTVSNPANYLRVLSLVDVSGDQRLFFNLVEKGSFTSTYNQTGGTSLDAKLDGQYIIGSNGYKTFGATAAQNHGGIFYEVLIFQSALSYTLSGSDLTAGDLKIVTDYLMNKYQIGTDYVS